MTVEIITDKVLINVADKKNMKNIIYNELIEMNLLPKGSKIENYFFQILKNSMILNSNKNLLQILRQKKIIEKRYNNLILAGKANTNLSTIKTYYHVLEKCKNLLTI